MCCKLFVNQVELGLWAKKCQYWRKFVEKQKTKQIEEFTFSESFIFNISIFCWYLDEFHGHFMVFLRLFCALFARILFADVVSHTLSMKIYVSNFNNDFVLKLWKNFEKLNQNISGLLDKVWYGQLPKNQRKERKKI